MEPSHDELITFLDSAERHLTYMRSLLEGSGVWIRSSDNRDIVAGAHLSRVVQTCESVFLLCRLGRAHDAAALCRVILEHSVSMMFLFSGEDPAKACNDFALDSLTHIGNSHTKAAKHHPEHVTYDPEKAQHAISMGEAANYQNKFSKQLGFLLDTFGEEYLEWYSDLVYSELSVRTHPHASGLEDFAPTSNLFKFRQPLSIEQCGSAAVLAWAFTLSSFGWISFVWGLTWTKELYASGDALVLAHPNVGPAFYVGGILPDLPTIPRKREANSKAKRPSKRGLGAPPDHPGVPKR